MLRSTALGSCPGLEASGPGQSDGEGWPTSLGQFRSVAVEDGSNEVGNERRGVGGWGSEHGGRARQPRERAEELNLGMFILVIR